MKKKLALIMAALVGIGTIAGCAAGATQAPNAEYAATTVAQNRNAAQQQNATYAAATTAAATTAAGAAMAPAMYDNSIAPGYTGAIPAVAETDAEWNTAKYDSIIENSFLSVAGNPLSTFSIDVDTASYANLRRMIRNGVLEIPSGAVRVEEILNYFKYNYPKPQEGEKFSISTELTDTPWNAETKLLRIGIQAEDIDYDALPPSNLVFLLDVSGSMNSADRLPMVQ